MGWLLSRSDVLLERAEPADVVAIRDFGEAHIRDHYAPLIGVEAADAQVRTWWNDEHLTSAITGGTVIVARDRSRVVGVAQWGRLGADPVIYKLYVHPEFRGGGLGPQLIARLIDDLPADAERVFVEHVAANERAAAFYEREGFAVERVDQHVSGSPALDQVWRVRALPS